MSIAFDIYQGNTTALSVLSQTQSQVLERQNNEKAQKQRAFQTHTLRMYTTFHSDAKQTISLKFSPAQTICRSTCGR